MQQPALGELAATQGAAATVHLHETTAGAALPGADGAGSSAGGGADQQGAAETAVAASAAAEQTPEEAPGTGLDALPIDALSRALAWLDLRPRLTCARVSRAWRQAALAATTDITAELRSPAGGFQLRRQPPAEPAAQAKARALQAWMAAHGRHVVRLDVTCGDYTQASLDAQPLLELPSLADLSLSSFRLAAPDSTSAVTSASAAGGSSSGSGASGASGADDSAAAGGAHASGAPAGASAAEAAPADAPSAHAAADAPADAAGGSASAAAPQQPRQPQPGTCGQQLTALRLNKCIAPGGLLRALGCSLGSLLRLEHLVLESAGGLGLTGAAGLGELPPGLTQLSISGARELELSAATPSLTSLSRLARVELEELGGTALQLQWLTASAASLTRVLVSTTRSPWGLSPGLRVSDDAVAPLSALPALAELKLVAAMPLARLPHLPASLTALEVAMCRHLRITPAAGLGAATALRRLAVSGIAEFDPDVLPRLPALTALALTGFGDCIISGGDTRRLLAALPACSTALVELKLSGAALQCLSEDELLDMDEEEQEQEDDSEDEGEDAAAARGERLLAAYVAQHAALTAPRGLTRLELGDAGLPPGGVLAAFRPGAAALGLRVLDLGVDVEGFEEGFLEDFDVVPDFHPGPFIGAQELQAIAAACPCLEELSLFATVHRGTDGRALTALSCLTSLVVGGAWPDDAAAAAVLARLTSLRDLSVLAAGSFNPPALLCLTTLELTRLEVESHVFTRQLWAHWPDIDELPTISLVTKEGNAPDVWSQFERKYSSAHTAFGLWVLQQRKAGTAASKRRVKALQQQVSALQEQLEAVRAKLRRAGSGEPASAQAGAATA